MKQTFIAILIIVTTILVSTGCKKSDSGSTVNPVKTDSGTVYFHLHTNLGDSEADYNTVYTLANGRQVSLSEAQMYVSNIQLVRQNGTIYTVPNVTLLKTLETETYLIATVPVDTYRSVKFNVGLNAATNQQTPSASAADILNHPEMWFNSSAQPGGYIFMNAQGKIDTTTNANGTTAQMQPFVYEIGTNAHYPQVSMPDHSPFYVVTTGQATYVHLIIDYSLLFNGVQLNNSSNLSVHSTADNSSAISNTITNNIPGMFRYEE